MSRRPATAATDRNRDTSHRRTVTADTGPRPTKRPCTSWATRATRAIRVIRVIRVGYPGAPAPRYASWGARLAAYLIDSVIINVMFYALYFGGALLGLGVGYLVDPTMESDVSALIGGGTIVIGFIAAFISPFLYMWLPVAKSGQTLGKKALSIRIVSLETGMPPGKGRAAARVAIFMGFSLITCGIGVLLDCLWPLWDEQRQSIHDKAASTIVVST